MIKKRAKSQVTIILVFIMAILFLFTLVSMNISRVSQKKTVMSNLTDSVGLRVASQLGSQANQLKQEFEIYGEELNEFGEPESCDVNWKLVWGGLLIIVGAALIWIPGVGAAGVTAGILLAIGGAATGIFGGIQQYTAHSQGAQEQLKLKFKSLSGFQQLVESPVYGVLSGLVDDTALVKDGFDMDRDNDKTDYIPRFFKWYIFRFDSFTALGPEYEKFYSKFFGKNRFYFKEDSNGMVMKRDEGDDPERPRSKGWWVDWQVDYNGGKLKLVPWLNNELKPMLAKMREYGYGINGTESSGNKIVNLDDLGWKTYEELIGIWVNEIEAFENIVARGLYDLDRDAAIGGVDSWLDYIVYQKNANLCPGVKDEKDQGYEDWFTRLGLLEGYAVELKLKLLERKVQIHNCIEPCARQEWDCCGGGGPCCAWSCELWRPLDTRGFLLAYNNEGVRSVYDGGGGILPAKRNLILAEESSGDDGGGCVPVCIQTMGCCGAEVRCGGLCNDANCKPSHMCNPPLGGPRWCCDVLPLEPYCSDNIVDVGFVSGRSPSPIQVLDSFIADVEELRVAMLDFYKKVEEINRTSYDKMHEAFYVWKDKVGSTTAQTQEVGHIAYVKFELDNPTCFALPSIKHRQIWDPLPKTCVSVRHATGEFTLTVARFDEDTAKKGPLSRFWQFRFGKKSISADDEAFVRSKAKQLLGPNNNIDSYIDFNDADKGRLRGILRNGIVSKVRVHYGPGYTYSEEDKKKGLAKSSKENKDIYIEWTSSDYDKK